MQRSERAEGKTPAPPAGPPKVIGAARPRNRRPQRPRWAGMCDHRRPAANLKRFLVYLAIGVAVLLLGYGPLAVGGA